uniref:Uncharacterized protein n=1 Tax=Chaetoceros debilis TaxID=122233 RepID=A0A6S8YH38_9STRA
MNEITLQIAEAPNAPKQDFLATLCPVSSSTSSNLNSNSSSFDEEDIPFEITIDSYSRESWSINNSNSCPWKSTWFKSTDGKNRLPGFLKFLMGRKKSAYGKFESPHPDEVTGDFTTALFLVPFDQPLYDGDKDEAGDFIYVKYILDDKHLAKAKAASAARQSQAQAQAHAQTQTQIQAKTQAQQSSSSSSARRPRQKIQQKTAPSSSSQPSSSSSGRGGLGGGLLGNLLGAQQRTNQHLDSVPQRKKEKESSLDNNDSNNDGPLTSGQVINKFRDKIEKDLMEFNTSSQTEIKISISIADLTRTMEMHEKSKVTMDVLKYVVYEQAEEINEEWVAAKEPGEFMDETTIAVYKEGYAPADVLEDLNKGELPDEVKQQQRAMREAMEREEKKKMKMIEEVNKKKLSQRHAEVSALNMGKRDRRSIEKIQKDMGVGAGAGGEKKRRL